MKKFACYFLLVAAAALSACVGPQGPQGPQGEPGESTQWSIINLTVPAGNWQLNSNNGTNPYYHASFDVPELTEFIYEQGMTKCYIEFNRGTGNAFQQELPYVRHFEEYDTDNNQITWTQTVDYDFGIGFVNVYVTFSDFYVNDAPESMDFRLVLMW